jgi:hypothetical protein
VAAGSVVVLAEVRNGSLDAVDGVVLTAALVIFARALIRIASESGGDQAGRSR